MIDDTTESIISEIFGRNSGWDSDAYAMVKMCPGFRDIKELAALLARDPREEDLQQFLAQKPQFLFGLFGQGDDCDIAFVTKPSIGTTFNADFAILNLGQGGCSIHLVEIEKSSEPLFTAKLTPAKTLQSAIGQVQDWSQWISSNKRTFVNDILKLVKKLPLYPETSPNASFRLRSCEDIENGWRSFGGYSHPRIRYSIIAGRWAQMPEEHRERLTFLNTQDNQAFTVNTFDSVARRAYIRPTIWP